VTSRPGQDPAAIVAALEAEAARWTTRIPDGGTMVWRRWGAGPPVVLIHGASGSWTHWLRNIRALAARHTVVVPDLPGFGDSDDLREPHTAERLADAVAAGLPALGPAAGVADVVGFSFGSIVAGLLAARAGAGIRRLVLIGAGGLALRTEVGRIALARLGRGMDGAAVREVHRENLRRLMLASPAAADELAVHLQADNLRRARFRSGSIPTSDVLLRALPDIRVPLAAIYGARDAFVVPHLDERRQALARCHPDVDFRVVAGAGHWVIYEAAATVNAMLTDLLGPGAGPPGPGRVAQRRPRGGTTQ
jgi:pimeloyl-ACP methyl ester carboxylesterase